MSVIETIYLIFLIGSLAFGLEAMCFGFGGKILLFLRRRRGTIFLLAYGLGLVIVSLGIGASMFFNLEPIYFAILVMLFSLVAGRIIGALGNRLAGRTTPPPLPESADEEIRKIVSARGYGHLLERSGQRRKKPTVEKS
ncbi:MAG: hypothetical protein QW835_02795 [Candidatus Hadarchaeum sp.]|uniref:hypothetical protein n=1 Tax=Candidatus Hadarchaeum sp. TaxID=2883567 RepID=UPI0031745235